MAPLDRTDPLNEIERASLHVVLNAWVAHYRTEDFTIRQIAELRFVNPVTVVEFTAGGPVRHEKDLYVLQGDDNIVIPYVETTLDSEEE